MNSKKKTRFLREFGDPEHITNKPNAYGQTPLYLASKHGHLIIVKYLIQCKANAFFRCKVKL